MSPVPDEVKKAVEEAVEAERQRIVQMIRARASYCAAIAESFPTYSGRWAVWKSEADSMSAVADTIIGKEVFIGGVK